MGLTYDIAETFHPEMMDLIGAAIIAPIRGGSFIFESLGSAAGYVTGITDGERIRFDLRVTKQLSHQGYLSLRSLGEMNPVKRICKIVIGRSHKSSPAKYAEAAAKFAAKYGVKKVAVMPFIEITGDLLAGFIVSRYMAKKSIQGVLAGGLTLGIGAGLTVASIYDSSYYAARDLKHKNPVIYQELYNQNLECFWFLVQKQLERFV